MVDKLIKQGINLDNNKINHTAEDIIYTVENLTKNNSKDKLSDNYKLDFYATLKALHN